MVSEQERLRAELAELNKYKEERNRANSDIVAWRIDITFLSNAGLQGLPLVENLKHQMQEAQRYLDMSAKNLQDKYGISPNQLDKAIEERERSSPERQVPSLAERRAAKLVAQEQPQAPVAPPPQAPASTQDTQTQAQTHHERERYYRDMSGYRLSDGPDGKGGLLVVE